MTGTISASTLDSKRAQQNFARLMAHVADLYCMGGSSSISSYEARELATSVTYVLGMAGALAEEVARALDAEDPIVLWHEGLAKLDTRVDAALDIWREIIATMPPIRNVALRDTLIQRVGGGDSGSEFVVAHRFMIEGLGPNLPRLKNARTKAIHGWKNALKSPYNGWKNTNHEVIADLV